MMLRMMVAVVVFGLAASGIEGQAAKPGGAAAAQGSPAKAVEDLVGGFETEMVGAAKAMPAEKYNFSPATLAIPGATFTGVRTFADEVRHVAQANYAIASNITGTDPSVDLKTIGALKSKDEIVAALMRSFTAVHRSIATITLANENEAVDDVGVGPNQTKISEAAWVAVHGYDHYGQMVEYLRMNGIVPPGKKAVPVA